jgi:anti-sigma regulatory factor (Ser/Thr protein kinase)
MTKNWPPITHTATLDSVARSAQSARNILRRVCGDVHIPTETVETALLLVSELVTNAVVHSRSGPTLDIEVEPDLMHVAVTDDAAGTPEVARDVPVLAEQGRGLLLVQNLSSRWGVNRRVPAGKTVWFELDRSRTAPS